MKLKSILIIACCNFLLLVSCTEGQKDKEEKGLNASLINNPRSADIPEEIATKSLATMEFMDTVYDFGKMHEGESASYDFKFTNNGKEPLLIAKAAGTCGCTVPDYPHQPIGPGQSGNINVKFNSEGKTGLQSKSVNIFTNSKRGTHVLTIKAEVLED